MTQRLKELVVVLFAGLMLAGMAYFESKRTDPVQQEIDRRVVKIQVFYKDIGTAQGSGTKIGNHLILTNAHLFLNSEQLDAIYKHRKKHTQLEVLYEVTTSSSTTQDQPVPDYIYITDPQGHTENAVLISSAPQADFAFLSYKLNDNLSRVKLALNWNYGEKLILEGNPITSDFVHGRTQIIGYSYFYNPMHYARFSFVYPCNTQAPGFSGSGIYNDRGELMGIAELGEEGPGWVEQILIHAHLMDRQEPQCMAIPIMELNDEIKRRLNNGR